MVFLTESQLHYAAAMLHIWELCASSYSKNFALPGWSVVSPWETKLFPIVSRMARAGMPADAERLCMCDDENGAHVSRARGSRSPIFGRSDINLNSLLLNSWRGSDA